VVRAAGRDDSVGLRIVGNGPISVRDGGAAIGSVRLEFAGTDTSAEVSSAFGVHRLHVRSPTSEIIVRVGMARHAN
jgi:hypothetical protein